MEIEMIESKHERPGFMMYHDLLDSLEEYSLEERGSFLYAMRDYVRYGEIPEFSDRGLRALWKRTQPSLDLDEQKYANRCRKNRYNAYVGAQKKVFRRKERDKNIEPVEGVDYLSYEDWVTEIDSRQAVAFGSDCLLSVAYESQTEQNRKRNGNQNEDMNSSMKTIPNSNMNQKTIPYLNQKANERGVQGGEMGPQELFNQWKQAIDSKDLTKAQEIDNALSRLGYRVNHREKTIEKRNEE